MVAASILFLGLLPPWQSAPAAPKAAAQAARLVDAGIDLSHRARFPEAAAKFVEALELDPANAEAHYLLGLIRQQDGRAGAAMESFRSALRYQPRFAPAQARVCELETAAARARESGYDRALAACRLAASLDPRDPEPRFHAGWLLGRQGNHGAAIVEYQAALRLNPKLTGVKIELAMAYVDARDLARAIPLLREIVAAEPANANAKFQLGAALAKQGDCAMALPLLEAGVEAAQKHYLLAGCYKRLGREHEAAAEFERIKEARAGAEARMQARYRAAVAHQKAGAGRLDEAISEYRSALALHPDPVLRIDLAVALLKNGDAAAVLPLLEGDADPLARYQTALALGRLSRHDEARRVLEEALAARPAFVEARYQLGVTLAALGDTEAAGAALAEAARLRPDDPALRQAAARAASR